MEQEIEDAIKLSKPTIDKSPTPKRLKKSKLHQSKKNIFKLKNSSSVPIQKIAFVLTPPNKSQR